jgi:toxin secretion/phage lysis holin
MNVTHVTTGKITLTAVLAILSLWVEAVLVPLIVPLIILLTAMILDYITAIMAAGNRGQKICSDIGKKGIKKKVDSLVLVMVGVLLDLLLLYCATAIGIDFPIKFAASVAVTMWLVVNELISICENIKDSGRKLPPLLEPLLKNLKSKVEGAGKATVTALGQSFDEGGGE